MLAAALEGGRQTQEVGLRLPRRSHERDQTGLAFGERARLVHDERVDPFQDLERLGVFDEDAGHGAAPRGDHDRHRRGQPEGARTCNDEHRHRIHESVGHPRLGSEQAPDGGRDHGDRNDRRHEVGGDCVSEPLDRRPAPLGVVHHAHDLGE